MLEIEDVHNYYPGEEDLRFPIITALLPQDFQTIYIYHLNQIIGRKCIISH